MKKAYIFPGQGAQFPGMGKTLYDSNTLAKDMFEEANAIAGFRISDIMFGGTEADWRRVVGQHAGRRDKLVHGQARREVDEAHVAELRDIVQALLELEFGISNSERGLDSEILPDFDAPGARSAHSCIHEVTRIPSAASAHPKRGSAHDRIRLLDRALRASASATTQAPAPARARAPGS